MILFQGLLIKLILTKISYNKEKNKLVDDFIYDIDENSINIINAVSPAFTSCLALSERIINTISN